MRFSMQCCAHLYIDALAHEHERLRRVALRQGQLVLVRDRKGAEERRGLSLVLDAAHLLADVPKGVQDTVLFKSAIRGGGRSRDGLKKRTQSTTISRLMFSLARRDKGQGGQGDIRTPQEPKVAEQPLELQGETERKRRGVLKRRLASHLDHADGVVPVRGEPSKSRYCLPSGVEIGFRVHHQNEGLRHALLTHHLRVVRRKQFFKSILSPVVLKQVVCAKGLSTASCLAGGCLRFS